MTELERSYGNSADISNSLAELEERFNGLVVERDNLASRADNYAERLDGLVVDRDNRQTRLEELAERFNLLEERSGDLRSERDSLGRRLSQVGPELAAAKLELTAFKEKVVEVASEAAEEHGWCSTIDEILGELGLERARLTYKATLQITVEFRAEMSSRRDLPEESWVKDSLQEYQIRRAIENNFGMDSSHASASIGDVEFEVTDVRSDDDD